jgi:hypothetical protein
MSQAVAGGAHGLTAGRADGDLGVQNVLAAERERRSWRGSLGGRAVGVRTTWLQRDTRRSKAWAVGCGYHRFQDAEVDGARC